MSVPASVKQAISPDQLAAEFAAALLPVMTRIGKELSLDPVVWSVIEYPGGLVVDGRLSELEPDRAATCKLWATALGMDEYTWPGDEGQRSWHLEKGAWTIEISYA